MSLKGRVFGNFPARVVSEVVGVIGERDGDEGELESLGKPMFLVKILL